jgi:FlgD Ig-like domain
MYKSKVLFLAVLMVLLACATAQARVSHGYSEIFSINTVSAVDDNASAPPLATTLSTIYPNPFNPKTTIEFTLAEAGAIELAVFDLRGRLVKVLDQESRAIGRYRATWDGRDQDGRAMPANTYICRLVTSHGTKSQKLILTK